MHALLADLLPWVIAFYLADGLAQLGRGHVILAGSGALRPLGAGLRWLGASPLAEAIALFDLPFLAGGDRIHLFDPRLRRDPAVVEPGDLASQELAALAPVTREARKVLAAGRPILRAPTPEAARELAALLAAAAGAGRIGAGGSRDLAAARALRGRQRPYRLALQALAAALAALLLVAAPLAAWSPLSDRIPVAPLLAAVGALLLGVAVAGGAMLRSCGEDGLASVAGGLGLLLPWAALHPLTHASRALYRRFDALTAAAALLPEDAFHALAARELARARLSRERAPAALVPAWLDRERHLGALLVATGSSSAAALAGPARAPGAAAFCPACRTLYRSGFEQCADCGTALVRFEG